MRYVSMWRHLLYSEKKESQAFTYNKRVQIKVISDKIFQSRNKGNKSRFLIATFMRGK